MRVSRGRWTSTLLDYRNELEFERCLVEIECGAIADAHVQTDVATVECFDHDAGCLIHELLGEAETTIGSFYRLDQSINQSIKTDQRRDMPMRIAGVLLLHLGENVADHLTLVVLGNVRELWPTEILIR